MLEPSQNENEPVGEAEPGDVAETAAGAEPTEAAATQAQPAATGAAPPKEISVPTSAIAKIKREAEERGQKRAAEALARELGFSSVEEMKAAARPKPKEPEAKPVEAKPKEPEAKVAKPQADREAEKLRRDLEAERAKTAALSERAKREEIARRKERQARLAAEARASIREAASKAGARDADYATHLLLKEVQGKTPAELESFDEIAFFKGLRDTHPHLFTEVERPATTGTGAGGQPPSPKPGDVARKSGDGAVDARKMDKQQWTEYLASKGLSQAM